MNFKTERAIETAVTKTNKSKWEKTKKWSRRALLATASAISITAGIFGTSQQMNAQNPQNYVTVNVNDLGAYLNSRNSSQNNQQQYAQIYANRDTYRQQQAVRQAPYASPEWLAARGLEPASGKLNRNINRKKFIGAFYNWNSVDRYGRPASIIYLPRDQHDSPITINIDDANKAAAYPGGDALGLYRNPHGVDINNPENNVYHYEYNNAAEIIHDAAHTIGHIIHHVKGRHHH